MHLTEKTESTLTVRPQPARPNNGAVSYPIGKGIVRAVMSSRAGGLVLDVNVHPGGDCNFACAYCGVDRTALPVAAPVSAHDIAEELTRALDFVRSGQLFALPGFRPLASQFHELRQVALTGDAEPTLAPNFREIIEAIVHVRALSPSFFKIVLLTNASQLHLPHVQAALDLFTSEDEVWTKLDGGSQSQLQEVNGTLFPLQTLLQNIQLTARRRPVVIQSMFSSLSGVGPDPDQIIAFTQRLTELKNSGARISSVQIYSATSSERGRKCTHLPLQSLSRIARAVRQATGLKVEIY